MLHLWSDVKQEVAETYLCFKTVEQLSSLTAAAAALLLVMDFYSVQILRTRSRPPASMMTQISFHLSLNVLMTLWLDKYAESCSRFWADRFKKKKRRESFKLLLIKAKKSELSLDQNAWVNRKSHLCTPSLFSEDFLIMIQESLKQG